MRKNNNRSRGRPRVQRSDSLPPINRLPENELPLCPLCSKPVKDLFAAVSFKRSGDPSHFECILAEVSAAEILAEGERVAYLGNGNFGVVQEKTPGNPATLVVKKKIQYESKEQAQSWRRNFLITIP